MFTWQIGQQHSCYQHSLMFLKVYYLPTLEEVENWILSKFIPYGPWQWPAMVSWFHRKDVCYLWCLSVYRSQWFGPLWCLVHGGRVSQCCAAVFPGPRQLPSAASIVVVITRACHFWLLHRPGWCHTRLRQVCYKRDICLITHADKCTNGWERRC